MKIRSGFVLVLLIVCVVFLWRLYLNNYIQQALHGNEANTPESIDPCEPLLKPTGCGMAPRVVRVNLGNLEAAFTGDPSTPARKLARLRLSNEVRCNKSTQLFSIQWNLSAGSARTQEQFKYNRKTKTLSYARSFTMMDVPPEKPHHEVHRNVTDNFIYKMRYY
jgi:hypothetical protein